MSNTGLVEGVRNAVESQLRFEISPNNLQLLFQAKRDFNLAPDDFVDVARTPSSVRDFAGLVGHLRLIQRELADPTEQTKTSGRLRYYKVMTCCINALASYCEVHGREVQDMTMLALRDAVMTHARSNPPPSLSTSGKVLWDRTFEQGSGRTSTALSMVLYLINSSVQEEGVQGPRPQLTAGEADDEEGDGGGEVLRAGEQNPTTNV
jgi:hypothetical protein